MLVLPIPTPNTVNRKIHLVIISHSINHTVVGRNSNTTEAGCVSGDQVFLPHSANSNMNMIPDKKNGSVI